MVGAKTIQLLWQHFRGAVRREYISAVDTTWSVVDTQCQLGAGGGRGGAGHKTERGLLRPDHLDHQRGNHPDHQEGFVIITIIRWGPL